jgi:hypothetical protein
MKQDVARPPILQQWDFWMVRQNAEGQSTEPLLFYAYLFSTRT